MQMTKKVLSIVLAVMMVVSMMTVMAVGSATVASAATAKTVYFTKPNNWSTVKCYAWDADDNSVSAAWPGDDATFAYTNDMSEDVYSYSVPSTATGIIFSDNGSNQTTNITTFAAYEQFYIDNGNVNSVQLVAKVGTKFYAAFADAVTAAAADNATIELVANAGSYTMTVGQVIKVIKNSKTLTLNAPEGAYAVEQTAYDSSTKAFTYTAVEAVASATKSGTTTYYASAYDALRNAATGSTITLLKNSTESAVTVGTKLSGKTYIIDLNDKTLTLNGNGNALFNIASPSDLTIKNGKIVFDGSGSNQNGFQLNDVYNTAVLTIEEDAVVQAKGSCSAVTVSGGTLNTEGVLSSENSPAIDTYTVSMGSGSAVNVNGGSVITTNAPAIRQARDNNTLTITDGVISGSENSVNKAIEVTEGTTSISGGLFNSDVSAYTTSTTYQNANGEVVAKAANTIYDDGDFAAAAAAGGNWYIVADVSGDGVTVTSNLKIWNTDKDHTISGDITVANGASIAKGGKKKVTFTGKTTLNGGSVSDANFTEIVVENDPYVHGQINNVPSGAIIKDGDGKRIVYDAISLAFAAKNGSEVYLVDDISDMYMTMNVNSGTLILHGNDHTINFTYSGDYGSALGKNASIEIEDVNVTVASGKSLKSFIKANAADDNTGSVSVDNVTATGFSTENVYTGGGDWTFANATVTSATEPECPDGWKAVDNNDGTWSIVACDYIAQVGETKYETLNEAVADAMTSGDEIYLLKDLTAAQKSAYTKPSTTGTFVVHANGFSGYNFAADSKASTTPYVISWTISGTGKNSVYTYTIAAATVKVTRTNGDEVYPTSLYNSLAGTVGAGRAADGDTVTLLADCELDANKSAIQVKNTGVTLDLGGYTLTGARANYLEVQDGKALTIENGTVGGEGTVKVGAGSTLALDNATVSADLNALADAEITFANGAGVTGDIDVPEDYKVVTNATTGAKTVVPKGLQDYADEAFQNSEKTLNFVDGNSQPIKAMYKASLLGVQIRKELTGNDQYTDGNGKNGLRFITAVDKDFLATLDDYGYEIYVDNTLKATQSCKDSAHNWNNTISNPETDEDVQFFTAAIYNITNQTKDVTVKFYVTKGNDTAYAKYAKDGTNAYEITTNYQYVYNKTYGG